MSECWCQEGYFIGTNKNQNWVIQISLCTLLKKEKKSTFWLYLKIYTAYQQQGPRKQVAFFK